MPGTYRVEILIDGVPFTEGSFTIKDDRPSFTLDSLYFFESGKDVPTKGQRHYATHFLQEKTRYVNFELCLNNLFYEGALGDSYAPYCSCRSRVNT